MTNLKEIKFALENGHTNVTMGTELDGSFYVLGTFGYIATSDKNYANEIKELVAQYVTVEKSDEELMKEMVENKTIITIEKKATKQVKEISNKHEGLTDKEVKVLDALTECTYEVGLPVSVDEIKEITKMSKRSIVGVVSSLYKKGIVEEYDMDEGLKIEEFMLTEDAYNKYA